MVSYEGLSFYDFTISTENDKNEQFLEKEIGSKLNREIKWLYLAVF